MCVLAVQALFVGIHDTTEIVCLPNLDYNVYLILFDFSGCCFMCKAEVCLDDSRQVYVLQLLRKCGFLGSSQDFPGIPA